MFNKKIASISVIFLIGLLVAVLQIFRYEYFYEGGMRIDKVTGERQYHCYLDEKWKDSLLACNSIGVSNTPPESQASLKNPLDQQCTTHKQYIKASLSKGFICIVKLEDGKPGCGRDRDNSGVLKPWEIDFGERANLCENQ